ncbi:hypothetical protein CRENBAI_007333 [Crenichthys baileyi]|uniref:Uncharacterized protein n=1 Tax=Crenichthys baileyi TaxID=28760 RepID=A0AAV9RUR2_9TELE
MLRGPRPVFLHGLTKTPPGPGFLPCHRGARTRLAPVRPRSPTTNRTEGNPSSLTASLTPGVHPRGFWVGPPRQAPQTLRPQPGARSIDNNAGNGPTRTLCLQIPRKSGKALPGGGVEYIPGPKGSARFPQQPH